MKQKSSKNLARLTQAVFHTSESVSPLILRVLLGIVMFPHGAQKVLGWFGGAGFATTLAYFSNKMHIPAVFAILAILTEFLGPIALFLGFLTRLAAFAIAFDMLVAALLLHVHSGFFMNWLGKQKATIASPNGRSCPQSPSQNVVPQSSSSSCSYSDL
jgi:putative oxidoreductase